jgi:hypothetical protein
MSHFQPSGGQVCEVTDIRESSRLLRDIWQGVIRWLLEEVALKSVCFTLLKGRLYILNLRGLVESVKREVVNMPFNRSL